MWEPVNGDETHPQPSRSSTWRVLGPRSITALVSEIRGGGCNRVVGGSVGPTFATQAGFTAERRINGDRYLLRQRVLSLPTRAVGPGKSGPPSFWSDGHHLPTRVRTARVSWSGPSIARTLVLVGREKEREIYIYKERYIYINYRTYAAYSVVSIIWTREFLF